MAGVPACTQTANGSAQHEEERRADRPHDGAREHCRTTVRSFGHQYASPMPNATPRGAPKMSPG